MKSSEGKGAKGTNLYDKKYTKKQGT